MALVTAGWVAMISLAVAAKNPSHTVIFGRLGFAFASAIPFFLIWMVDAVPGSSRGSRTIRVTFPGIACGLFVLASLSPLIIARAAPGLPRADIVYGPFHRLFGVYFVLSFASGLYTLWHTIQSASGINRLQLRYLLLGISLTGGGAVTTNLLIPLVWRTSHYSALGPYFALIFFAFSAHAIIRYRLMDIRVVIKNGVVYVCTIVISGIVFLTAAELLRQLAGYDTDHVPLVVVLIVAMALAISFQPLRARIQNSLNRYLYRETYSYHRTVKDASRQLSTMLELQQLLAYLTKVIENTFKVEAVSVYLRDTLGTAFTMMAPEGHEYWRPQPSSLTLVAGSPLVEHLQYSRKTLVREETRNSDDQHLTTAASALQGLGGDIAFPLLDEKTVIGILVVGSKRSGDPYFTEDIDLLETLVSQAAVAMKNAQLYREVVLVNEYVDNILSTMESGVVAVTASGDISLFNPAAERLTSLRAVNVKGRTYTYLPSALASPLQDILTAGTPRSQFETLIPGPEGASVPLVCSTAVLRDREGSTHGALIVFSDVTRLKDLEREKRRSERLASFGALASGVAHEIKNPLVAIRTFAELLPERFLDTDFREDFSKVVIREIARIDDLVGRLRGIAATAPPQVGSTDIREPIRDTIALLRGQLEQTRTIVNCAFEDSHPFVAVEEAQLKQLFLNLLLNSIEAMGSGGEVTVSVARRELRGSEWIVADVSDIGPGIPEPLRTTVFNPFFTTKPRGSGLGLAICRGIVDAHRGTIRAENRADRPGARIVVEFPASIETPVLQEQAILHS